MRVITHRARALSLGLAFSVLSACTTSPPEQVDNVCDIFRE